METKSQPTWQFPGFPKAAARILATVLFLAALLFPALPAWADVAPPSQPPGTNIAPGSETTQVRMAAETVVLAVQKRTPAGSLGQALVTAKFQMHNLGSADERMDVRFPLTFWNGESNGFFKYPEIADLKVKVNGGPVPTHRVTMPNDYDPQGPGVPWAAFAVNFPAGKDVAIEVDYTSEAFGEGANVAYRYILETGAGWKDTIGSADLVVRLPYEANNQNVVVGQQTGFSETTPGGAFSGNEVRWHYDALEPSRENNLEVTLVTPDAWQKVLDGRAATQKKPNDGEAWGQLGKAYKEIIGLRKGVREDDGGKQMYALGLAAYQKSVELLPKDALWHLGYADMLWQHYFWVTHWTSSDTTDLVQALKELKTSLALSPNEQRTHDLLDAIAGTFPDAVQPNGSGYDFPGLTATPKVDVYVPPTETPTEAPTEVQAATQPPAPPETLPATDTPAAISQATQPPPAAPSATPAQGGARLPICGGAVILPVLGALWLGWRGRRSK